MKVRKISDNQIFLIIMGIICCIFSGSFIISCIISGPICIWVCPAVPLSSLACSA